MYKPQKPSGGGQTDACKDLLASFQEKMDIISVMGNQVQHDGSQPAEPAKPSSTCPEMAFLDHVRTCPRCDYFAHVLCHEAVWLLKEARKSDEGFKGVGKDIRLFGAA
jgi:hypothetical protein